MELPSPGLATCRGVWTLQDLTGRAVGAGCLEGSPALGARLWVAHHCMPQLSAAPLSG